jgi:hypothetical protein
VIAVCDDVVIAPYLVHERPDVVEFDPQIGAAVILAKADQFPSNVDELFQS